MSTGRGERTKQKNQAQKFLNSSVKNVRVTIRTGNNTGEDRINLSKSTCNNVNLMKGILHVHMLKGRYIWIRARRSLRKKSYILFHETMKLICKLTI